MPLVRIDVDASISPDTLSTICDVVYDAMISTAKAPAHDKFMIVSKHDADDLVFPYEGFLGVKYTPGIVFIQITWNVAARRTSRRLSTGRSPTTFTRRLVAARKTSGSTSSRFRRRTGPSVTVRCSTHRSDQFNRDLQQFSHQRDSR
jgi:hypothetical protein